MLASLSGAGPVVGALITRFALPLALALSLSLNAWQLHKHGQSTGKAEGELQAAVERGRAEALAQRADQMTRLATLAEEDRSAVLQDLERIAERGQQARIVYRAGISQLPAASCAPGRERMGAVNALVGGE
jgi:hypothetical protein